MNQDEFKFTIASMAAGEDVGWRAVRRLSLLRSRRVVGSGTGRDCRLENRSCDYIYLVPVHSRAKLQGEEIV